MRKDLAPLFDALARSAETPVQRTASTITAEALTRSI